MKKILFAVLTVIVVSACNSPQKMTSPTGDSMTNTVDSSKMMQGDSTMRKDSM